MKQPCSVQNDYAKWQLATPPFLQMLSTNAKERRSLPCVKTVAGTMHDNGKPVQHTNPNAMDADALATGRISALQVKGDSMAIQAEISCISTTEASPNQEEDRNQELDVGRETNL